jgi:hypothetical protein
MQVDPVLRLWLAIDGSRQILALRLQKARPVLCCTETGHGARTKASNETLDATPKTG